ncbi:MAG: PAS domain-containing protein [Verrucomicrobia bacterium]|nr:PAS domain-containing protein [Verrucomicrobiota bacterium]
MPEKLPSPRSDSASASSEVTAEPDSAVSDLADSGQSPRERLEEVIPARGLSLQPIVGLGGSAGSLNALRTFFSAMPADSGLAFVVVVHLSPHRDSNLASVLQGLTPMPVVRVHDPVNVEADHVYVIPPGKHLSVADGRLRLVELQSERGQRVAVDLFFRSLAETHGPRATAIVLSGADNDGAIGLKRVKERGGLTIAQEPAEAPHDGMPRAAIGTGMVDWVLPAAAMPRRLLDYYRQENRLRLPSEELPDHPSSEVSETEGALRDVLALLRARTGHNFADYKRATLLRRLARRLQVNALEDLPAYLAFLRTHPGEVSALLQDLLISVTNFFRDREAFQTLESELPRLFHGKKAGDAIRVWVAGCATGEEAYSVAMLLAEHAARLAAPPTLQIFATDLDEGALRVGREGLYPETIAADVSEERLRRFFIRDQGRYHINRAVRETVLFALHNVLKDAPFSHLDMISCRNLLIYLKREAQMRAFELFHFALETQGLLFLGSSESADEAGGLFRPLNKKHRLYLRVTVPRPVVPTLVEGPSSLLQNLELRPPPARSARPEAAPWAGTGARPTNRLSREQTLSLAELHFRLLEGFVPDSVLVDHEDRIVHLSVRAERYLHLGSGEATLDLLRVVHPMLRLELRGALFRARQTASAVQVTGVQLESSGERRALDLHVRPAQGLAPGFLLVAFDERPLAPAEIATAVTPSAEPLVRQLETELDQLKLQQRATVEEYEASLEELKSSNEELQAINEELRSATEEVETGREELQSINEELSTVNQELKHKVEELAKANSDLQNLMAATDIATIFLDRQLRIQRYTPAAVRLFSLIPTDLGRPLSDLSHRLEDDFIVTEAERVLASLVPVEREKRSADGHWYLARLLPYRSAEDRISGVVLTFVDITERKTAEDERGRLLAAEQVARREAEAANRAKDRFLAVLSHELCAPLSPVRLALSTLQHEKRLSPSGQEARDLIARNVDAEIQLIDDLLDVNRIVHGKLQLRRVPLDVHACVRQAVEISQEDFNAKRLQLALRLEAMPHQVWADGGRLRQAFWNLLKNAAKFTPEGGQVTVRSRNLTEAGEPRIAVEITDNGIGIEPEALAKIFDPFEQGSPDLGRRYGGLGLGLAIARSLVEAHGGRLWATSAGPGQGASFTVEVPALPAETGPSGSPPADEAGKPQ